MKLADRMDCLGTETAFAVSAEASNLEAKGVKIYPFHLGDINLETPKTIRSAALEAIESGKTGYCPAPGIIELRKALAEDVSNSRNVKYTSNNVSVPVDFRSHTIYKSKILSPTQDNLYC